MMLHTQTFDVHYWLLYSEAGHQCRKNIIRTRRPMSWCDDQESQQNQVIYVTARIGMHPIFVTLHLSGIDLTFLFHPMVYDLAITRVRFFWYPLLFYSFFFFVCKIRFTNLQHYFTPFLRMYKIDSSVYDKIVFFAKFIFHRFAIYRKYQTIKFLSRFFRFHDFFTFNQMVRWDSMFASTHKDNFLRFAMVALLCW